MRLKNGITMISLIITIIIMVIIASVIIIKVSDSGLNLDSRKATYKNDLLAIKEEVDAIISLKKAKRQTVDDFYELSDLGIDEEEYDNVLIVLDGNLCVKDSANDMLKGVAEQLNIQIANE